MTKVEGAGAEGAARRVTTPNIGAGIGAGAGAGVEAVGYPAL